MVVSGRQWFCDFFQRCQTTSWLFWCIPYCVVFWGPVTSDSPKIEKMKLQASLDKKTMQPQCNLEKKICCGHTEHGSKPGLFLIDGKRYPIRLVFLYMDQAPLINEASKLEESLRSFVGKLPETEEVLKDCLVTAACNLEQRLELRAQNYHSRRRAGESQLANPMRLQLSRAVFKRKALKLQEQIRDNDGSKVTGRLRTMWLLRTALGDPCVPVRTLAEFCRDLHDLETSTISHTSIAAARDCFCEAII